MPLSRYGTVVGKHRSISQLDITEAGEGSGIVVVVVVGGIVVGGVVLLHPSMALTRGYGLTAAPPYG